jgi:PAS domain S-box-containing protein
MIVDAKDKFKIVTLNKQMALSLGKTEDELIGKNILDFLPSNISKFRKKSANEVIKNKKPVFFEEKRDNKYFLTNIHPLKNKKDIITHLLVFAEDITNYKDTELKLKKRENELEDTALKLTTITENVKVGLYYTDVNGNFLWANKKAAEIVGKTRKEMIGKNGKYLLDTKFISKKDYLKAVKLLTLVKLGKKAGPEVFNITQKDGIVKIVEIQAQKIKLHDENVIVGIVNDITNRKKVEKKRYESEEKFRVLSDQSLMGLGIIQEGKIKYVNDAITQIVGYSKEELFIEGTKILAKIIHPDYLSFVQEQLQKKLSGDKDVITRYSCKIITKTGEIKWIEIFSKTIEYERKNADFITFVDITTLKKTERTLKQSELKFRELANQSPNIIFINKNGKIVYVNQKAVDIMGYSSEEFLSDDVDFLTLIAPESRELVKIAFKKHQSGLDINPYEYIIVTKDGEKLNALITTKLIEYEGETAILGIVTDVTHLKKTEMNLKRGKNYLQKVIDSTSEIIFTIHTDLKIITWNKTAERITGYKKRQVVGKSIKQLDLFETSIEIQEYIKEIQNKKIANINEISINTIYGVKKIFSVSPSYIKDDLDNIIEILFVCRDITHEKEEYGKIQSGNSYLIQESENKIAIDIFNILLKTKKLGLYIGRISDKDILNSFKKTIPKIIKLTEQKEDRYLSSTNIEGLYQKIKNFIINKNNTIILIDRMDYLIINNPFESIMKTFYKINDLVQKHNSILLLRVNPLIINQNQIAILKDEFKKVPSQKISDIQISQKLFEILFHIQNEIERNFTVTYGNIGKKFSISKVTAKKRLESLIDSGLIFSRKQGKTKILNITAKGRNLLRHRTKT